MNRILRSIVVPSLAVLGAIVAMPTTAHAEEYVRPAHVSVEHDRLRAERERIERERVERERMARMEHERRVHAHEREVMRERAREGRGPWRR